MTVYRVTEPFAFDLPTGQSIVMHRGDLIDENHPAYKHKGGRDYLEPADESSAVRSEPISFGPEGMIGGGPASEAIETATAAPGEHRSISNPRRRRVE